jgi:hypothetical protein
LLAMGQEVRPFAHEMQTPPEQGPRGPHVGGRAIRWWSHAPP